ncbi:MAG TPA: hypothetical protein VFV47_02695 [Hyphomicrobiaceae bacterium]|nr:hypothetical protein [Hyphomicrobiaceae bacterium]
MRREKSQDTRSGASRRGGTAFISSPKEIRMGEMAVQFAPDELDFPIDIGDLTVTEC